MRDARVKSSKHNKANKNDLSDLSRNPNVSRHVSQLKETKRFLQFNTKPLSVGISDAKA